MLAISYPAFDLEFHPRRIRQPQSDDRHGRVSRTLDRFDFVISSPFNLRGDGVRNTSQAQRRFSTNQITDRIIGSAITIHRRLGPGLLEAAYESCLAYELDQQGLAVIQQKAVPLIYEHVKLECGFRADLLVENWVVVELKCKEPMHPVDEAQLLSHLRLLGLQLGLLINFCGALKGRNTPDGEQRSGAGFRLRVLLISSPALLRALRDVSRRPPRFKIFTAPIPR